MVRAGIDGAARHRVVAMALLAVALVLGMTSMASTASAADTTGTLRITAVDAGTGLPVANVDVFVQSLEDADAGTTGASGVLELTVDAGTFDISGHLVDQDGDHFEGYAMARTVLSGGTTQVVLTMVPRPPGIEAYVYDEAGASVTGARVDLVDDTQTTIDSVTTNELGLARFTDVTIDTTYTVVATVGELMVSASVTYDEPFAYVALSLDIPGIAVRVQGDDGLAAAGATIDLLDVSGVELDSLTADVNGYAKFTDVTEESTYTVVASGGGLTSSRTVVYVGGLHNVDLQLSQPGIGAFVDDHTFGDSVEGATVTLRAGSAIVRTAVTDENGFVKLTGLGAGVYDLSVAKDGFESPAPTQVVYAGGTYQEVYVELLMEFACEPATVHPAGLSNVGFEQGLVGWTQADLVEGVDPTGADEFTEPNQGSSMLRLGSTQPNSSETQIKGPNVLCQDFVVDQEVETFAYNVFTYDVAGFDEFRFDVAVSGEDGEVIQSLTETAWGTSTDLKTTDWTTVEVDLSDRMGETVRITLRSGGTANDMFAFWTYLDSAPPAAIANVSVPAVSKTSPRVGDVVTATPGTWSRAGVSSSVEWQDSAGAALGRGPSLTVTESMLGRQLRVLETATKPGFVSASAMSSLTAPVAPAAASAVVNTALPSISGTARVGEVLTADPGTWSPAEELSFEYEWRAGGAVVGEETTLALTGVHIGQQVTVTVTASRPGHVSATATSAPTLAVAAPPPTGPSASCLAAKAEQSSAQSTLAAASATASTAAATLSKLKAKLKKAKKSGKTAKIKKTKAKYKKARAAAVAANSAADATSAALTAASSKVAALC